MLSAYANRISAYWRNSICATYFCAHMLLPNRIWLLAVPHLHNSIPARCISNKSEELRRSARYRFASYCMRLIAKYVYS